jgi:hypothetical protein
MDEMPNFHASMGAGHLNPEDPSLASLVRRHGHRITFETDLGIPLDRGPDHPWNADMYASATARVMRTFEPMGRQALEAFARGNAERIVARARHALAD